jgi:hypothetical protein
MPLSLQAVPFGPAAIRRVQGAEQANERNGILGDLIARVPSPIVASGRDVETISVAALTVGQQTVELIVVIGMRPWAVIVIHLAAKQQVACAQCVRYAPNRTPVSIHAAFLHIEEVLGQRLEEL